MVDKVIACLVCVNQYIQPRLMLYLVMGEENGRRGGREAEKRSQLVIRALVPRLELRA